MMWPPPRSILFPYTTLFRSHHVERQRAREPALDRLFAHGRKADGRIVPRAIRTRGTGRPLLDVEQVVDRHHLRSEEHTSELQSLRHLVCRLLLEKKKTTRCTSRRRIREPYRRPRRHDPHRTP